MSKNKIAIIGSKDLGQQISHLIISDSFTSTVVGYYDDFQEKNTIVRGLPVLGKIDDISSQFSENVFDELIIAVGYEHFDFKKQVFEKFEGKIPFATFIHSSCIIDKTVIIKNGTVIYPGSIIDQNVIIRENVLINLGCTIAHDSEIESHCFLSPRVAIAGFVKIKEQCILGINSTIIDNITICSKTQLGGGCVVTKSITESGLYVGIPAKKIKDIAL